MLMYCVVCTSELESKDDNFICLSATRVFALREDAVKYGLDWCRSVWAYPAHADFYIYKLDSSGDLLSEIKH